MTEQQRTHAEAPASATAHETQCPRSTSKWIDPHGAQHLITVPAPSVQELLERLDFLGYYLVKHGWTPDGGARSTNGDGEHTLCPVHQTPMKDSKFGGLYCPVKNDDGTYCKEKVN